MHVHKKYIISIFLCCISLIPLQAEDRSSSRQQFIDALMSYKGTPYRYGGMSTSGIDCSGLLYLSAYNSLGIQLPRTVAEMYSKFVSISLGEMQPGDVLFFRTVGGTVSHAGVYLGGNRFIHAASEGSTTGVIVTSLDKPYWKKAFVGAARFIDEDYGEQYASIRQNTNAAYLSRDSYSSNFLSTHFVFDIDVATVCALSIQNNSLQFSGVRISGGLSFETGGFYCNLSAGLAAGKTYTAVPLQIATGYSFFVISVAVLPGVQYDSGFDLFVSRELAIQIKTPFVAVGSVNVGAFAKWGVVSNWNDSIDIGKFRTDAEISAGVRIRVGL